jgi:adenylosuccinate synthase
LRSYIIVDLGFGDSGKGLLTDFLVRRLGAGVVVRYNGGAQAGHNVVSPDGRHHTFSQFGSGTFIPGVRTYLSRHVVIHPSALLAEGDLLEAKGLRDVYSRLCVSDQALVITPFHQASNRIRELWRGKNRHGSCGVGVGEAVEDALLNHDDRVLAGDLSHPATLYRKLKSIRDRKREQIMSLFKDLHADSRITKEMQIFERADVIDLWTSSIGRITDLDLVVSDQVLEHWLHETENVVFEGAQGILLDQDAGFHPYTTWSRCTSANALELINELAADSQAIRVGVMRSYAIRHGPGPLPTETDELSALISEHNQYGEWQGKVRYGWFDAVLARYALDVVDGVDIFALTHLDLLKQLASWKYCIGYKGYEQLEQQHINVNRPLDMLESFRMTNSLSLENRTILTQALSKIRPLLESCKADERSVIRKIESIIGQTISIISRGPSAQDVEILNPIPM